MRDHSVPEELDEAFRLVGKFLYHFANLEHAIDNAVGKLLGLEEGVVSIVAANVPAAKKVDLLFSAENFLGAKPDKGRQTLISKTKNEIMKLNEKRVIAAHSQFDSAGGGGVQFRRVVAKKELKVTTEHWSVADVEGLCQSCIAQSEAVTKLADEMEPYKPSLDFSDPRNSGLMTIFF